MADRTFDVGIVIRAVDRATSVIRGITRSTTGLQAARARSDRLFSSAASIRQAAEGVNTFARAMRNALAAPIKDFESFQQGMANVRSKTKMSEEDFRSLTEQARELGRGTAFTAVEAANAMEFMAMAGFDANQIMAAVPTTLHLAAAAGTDLGRTSDILTDIMGAFGKEAKDATEVGDLLTRTFTGSNTTLETLFETMKLAGPDFRDLGIDMKEALAFAGIIGGAGLKGSLAGTGLRSILRGFTGLQGRSRKGLDLLGISTTKGGNLRKPLEIMQEVIDKTSKMGNVKRSNILSMIFGIRGKTPLSNLLRAIDKGDMQKMLDQLGDTSITSKQVAEDRLNTAEGATIKLMGAVKDLNIELGKKLEPTLTFIKESLTGMIIGITKWAKAHPTLTKAIMITAGIVTVLTTALAGLLFAVATVVSAAGLWALIPVAVAVGKAMMLAAVGGVAAMIKGLAALSIAALPIVVPIMAIAAAIGAVTLAIVELQKHWDQLDFFEGMKGIKESILGDGIASAPVNALKTVGQLLDPRTLINDLTGSGSLETLEGAFASAGNAIKGALKIEVEGNARVTEATMEGGDLEVVNTGHFGDEG